MHGSSFVQKINCFFNIVDRFYPLVIMVFHRGFLTALRTGRMKRDNLVVHAEANAVLFKGTANLENSIAFVTLFPCEDCAEMLIQVGRELCQMLSFAVLGNVVFLRRLFHKPC